MERELCEEAAVRPGGIPAFSLPLSIAFGIIALRQIRVFGNPGRGLASSTPPEYVHLGARQPSESDSHPREQHAVCTLETDFPTTGRVVH